jgi:hypothetical protein
MAGLRLIAVSQATGTWRREAMCAKRIMLLVVVSSVVMLALGGGPRTNAAPQSVGGWAADDARALSVAQAPEPPGVTIPYPGHLARGDGQPVPEGAYGLAFALYDAESGGEPLWSEMQESVLVGKDGTFFASLGSVNAMPDIVLKGDTLWLSVAVRGPGEAAFTALTPRQSLSAVAPNGPASLNNGAACPHDHFGEKWSGRGAYYGLAVQNADTDGQALVGIADNGTMAMGVFGGSENGVGVRGDSGNGIGVLGQAWAASRIGVYGLNYGGGTGVAGSSDSGVAISALGSGVVYSAADSVLYLSPHDMVAREENQALISITPLDNGGVRVRNLSANGTRYLSIPVSSFGTLFGSPLYVKSLEVCYKAPTTTTWIDATGVYKNNGSDAGWATYLEDLNNHSGMTDTCYPVSAPTPRKPIDNSTWVQFNMRFSSNGSGSDIYIYTVKLTLTEQQN